MGVLTRRIMGLETEYGLALIHKGQQVQSPEDSARALFEPIVAQHNSNNIFTENGSRIYLDVGAHPEYASPECDNLEQLILYEHAGDQFYRELLQQYQNSLEESNTPGQLFLFKNNIDSLGNTYGSHENYLLSRDTPLQAISKILIPFLVTRQLTSGAGTLRKNEQTGSTGFLLSQRAYSMWEGISSASTRSRPMINTRDEPHADSSLFRRMHVIVGDSNMSPYSTLIRVGSMLLLLEMIEAEFPLPEFVLDNEAQAIRDTSHWLEDQHSILLKDGTHISPLAIQQAFLQSAQDWVSVRDTFITESGGTPTSAMKTVIALWADILHALEIQDYSGIDTKIDWAIKYRLISQAVHSYKTSLDDPRILQIDLRYHDIKQGRGLYSVLQATGQAAPYLTNQDINRAVKQAPDSTRASIRGEVMSAPLHTSPIQAQDWGYMKFFTLPGEQYPREVILDNPFATKNPEIDAILNTLCNTELS